MDVILEEKYEWVSHNFYGLHHPFCGLKLTNRIHFPNTHITPILIKVGFDP